MTLSARNSLGGLRTLLILGAALGICALLLGLLGKNPILAGAALWNGATGSRLRLAETGARTIPLLLCGLSVCLAFRAGFFNIGAEGQFLLGSLGATFVGAKLGLWWPLGLLLGALAGSLWALLAGWLKWARGASEIITTIMLNYCAIQLVTFALNGPLQERAKSQIQSDVFPEIARVPSLLSGSNLHFGLFIALLLAPVCWFVLFRTQRGFLWQVAGKNPRLAQIEGISPPKNALFAVAFSGALAGLAGALEVAGATHLLTVGAPGYGFTAIAVALLADLNPLFTLPCALFFGILSSGAGAMERNAGVPALAVSLVVGTLVLALALVFGKRNAEK